MVKMVLENERQPGRAALSKRFLRPSVALASAKAHHTWLRYRLWRSQARAHAFLLWSAHVQAIAPGCSPAAAVSREGTLCEGCTMLLLPGLGYDSTYLKQAVCLLQIL